MSCVPDPTVTGTDRLLPDRWLLAGDPARALRVPAYVPSNRRAVANAVDAGVNLV